MGVQISQFILALSILIILHEMGHFIPAKLFKTRVEKFMLFFDPYFAIFKKKIGDTYYGIGWLPLGGYVKISGMVDESMDTDDMDKDPEPWEFRAKPAWQRLIILSGGVIVNFVLGYLIFAAVLFTYGAEYLPISELKHGIWTNEVGEQIGIKNGDKVLSVDGKELKELSEATRGFVLGSGGDLVLDRNGETITIPITDSIVGLAIADQNMLPGMFMPRMAYVVGGYSKDSPAKDAGLEKGDSIVSLNGTELMFFDEYKEEIPKFSGSEVVLGFYRDGSKQELSIPVSEDGFIGVVPANTLGSMYTLSHDTYSFGGAMSAAVGETWGRLSAYVLQFKKLIFRPETGAYNKVGGFYTIVQQFPTTWDWQRFWEFTAFLSLMLGFLNILPIPALDGGHIMFVLYEMVSGRKPSIKFLERAQLVGFILLLALLIFANTDFLRQ